MRHQLADQRVVLRGLVSDECHDHAVKIKEEHDQVEGEFRKRLLLAVSLGQSVAEIVSERTFLWTFSFRKISVASSRCVLSTILPNDQPCSGSRGVCHDGRGLTSWHSRREGVG